MPMTEVRTYETFSIHWSDGAVWSGGYTEAEAEEVVAFARNRSGRMGVVGRETFTVEVDPKFAHLYRPGV